MNWKSMVEREPDLAHLERSCRAAKQQGAKWHDFWSTHVEQINRLVGPVARCPALRSERAWKVVMAHLLQVWIDAVGKPRKARSPADDQSIGQPHRASRSLR